MKRPRTHRAWKRLDRVRRRLGLDRNELRREIDHTQWTIGFVMLVVYLAVAPPVSVRAGEAAYHAGLRSERNQAATRHQVLATVARIKTSNGPYGQDDTYLTWTAPDGTSRTAATAVQPSDKPGSQRLVWVNEAGRPTTKPKVGSQTVSDAAFATGTVAGVTGAPFLVVYLLVRRRCDRRRAELWEQSWERLDRRRIN
ncbi:hypothetical protein J4573_04630 [Actinomadura barringtoniae]|uniref:Transmembrane protein n=1 Tax=Actinomadura barringtoniae TaxID=1427535 RepID=A0A939T3A8_9ACTN|nr:hypothetical protein [Actinomadura barringtoniae]MBO2446364.1 hypothetical protein [Actinomadura barringtoniae]